MEFKEINEVICSEKITKKQIYEDTKLIALNAHVPFLYYDKCLNPECHTFDAYYEPDLNNLMDA